MGSGCGFVRKHHEGRPRERLWGWRWGVGGVGDGRGCGCRSGGGGGGMTGAAGVVRDARRRWPAGLVKAVRGKQSTVGCGSRRGTSSSRNRSGGEGVSGWGFSSGKRAWEGSAWEGSACEGTHVAYAISLERVSYLRGCEARAGPETGNQRMPQTVRRPSPHAHMPPALRQLSTVERYVRWSQSPSEM